MDLDLTSLIVEAYGDLVLLQQGVDTTTRQCASIPDDGSISSSA
jgi:hypothetical protein